MEWGREKDDSSNENQRVVIQIKVARHCTSKYDWCSLQSKKGKKKSWACSELVSRYSNVGTL